LCGFSEDFDAFTALTSVLPISVDAVPSLKEFRQKYDMKVTLLSDLKREASRAYGVLLEDAYISKRAYFLIDKAGVVRWAHIEEALGMKRDKRSCGRHRVHRRLTRPRRAAVLSNDRTGRADMATRPDPFVDCVMRIRVMPSGNAL
jgi:hypothetical protein